MKVRESSDTTFFFKTPCLKGEKWANRLIYQRKSLITFSISITCIYFVHK